MRRGGLSKGVEYRKAMETVGDRGRFPRRDRRLLKRAHAYTVVKDVLKFGKTRPHQAWQRVLIFTRGKLDSHYGLVRNGETLIVGKNGKVLEVQNATASHDLTDIARAAATTDVEAALAAAEVAVVKVAIVTPSDGKTLALLKTINNDASNATHRTGRLSRGV